MPARNARSISFTAEHMRLVDRLSKEHEISSAEVVRKIIDYAICTSVDPGIIVLAERQAQLERDLGAVKQQREALQAKKAEGSGAEPLFTPVRTSLASESELPKSPEELVRGSIGFLDSKSKDGEQTPSARRARQKIQSLVEKDPGLLDIVLELAPYRHLFKVGGDL